jgi:hypothetical protein
MAASMTIIRKVGLALALLVAFASGAAAGPLQVPNRKLTPGVTRPLSTADVCSTKWGTDERHVSDGMKKAVFEEYGIPWEKHSDYEVDHLVSRELAGDDGKPDPLDIRNLWPQAWVGPWNAHMKDRLENRLHKLVCDGTITLRQAQDAIRKDWRKAYLRYIGPLPRNPGRRAPRRRGAITSVSSVSSVLAGDHLPKF